MGERGAVPLVGPHVVQAGTHQALHGDDADLECLGATQGPRQLRMAGNEVEAPGEAFVELGILAEVEGDQHHVHHVLVEGVVEAGHQAPRMPGHPGEADLALLAGALAEFEPLRVVEPGDVVDGVVEVDVHVVGLQAPEAALQLGHDAFLGRGGRGGGLGGDDDALPLALERLAEHLFRLAAGVALRGVEIVDAFVQGVADQVLLAQAQSAGAE